MKKSIVSIILIAVMCLTLFPAAAMADGETDGNGTLTVAYPQFNGMFSPFFSQLAYDQDVCGLTQASLVSYDRRGAVITRGTGGQISPYNGTDYTYYSMADLEVTQNDDGSVDFEFILRDDALFSDGEPVTIDDVIFTMYVYCDPTYDGPSSFASLPIKGLADYRSGIELRGSLIYAAGPDGYEPNDAFTEEEYSQFWDYYNNTAGIVFAQEIIDYCVYNYGEDYSEEYTGHTYAEVLETPEYQVMLGMWLWGYGGSYVEGATAQTFWDAMLAAYDGDVAAVEAIESMGRTLLQITIDSDPAFRAAVETGISAPNVSGIVKTGPDSVRVSLTEFGTTYIYVLGIPVAPMHYYGNEDLYDYDRNMFGFPKADLSLIHARDTEPMGAGPYRFVSYDGTRVTFAANEHYYLGEPKISDVVFKSVTSGDLVRGVVEGDYDIASPAFTDMVEEHIRRYNRNGELTGNRITTVTYDNLGYGYIGINATNVSVGNEPDSEASKDLRKALATALSLFREKYVEEYYGDHAIVINYPITNSSWAAPYPGEDGYETAFSRDVSGAPIYSAGMSEEEKREAVRTAVLGYLEAAGYTVSGGRVTAAPGGASLEYSILVPGGGVGDHPAYGMAHAASDLLAEAGITLNVRDLENSSDLWEMLDNRAAELWCAAWGSAIDPDMYQIYHSSNVLGLPGSTGSNKYDIQDAELDSLIMAARSMTDQTQRRAIYRQCLDIIMDWAVEVPFYQRQNAYVFSTKRIDTSTLTDITALYGWMSEIQNIELLPFTGYELTLDSGDAAVENPVTVTGVVDEGEYLGTTSFTVECGEPCMVLCSRDWGETYERLTPITSKAGHSFSVDFDGELTIAVVKIGDAMLDGDVTTNDILQMKRFIAEQREFGVLQIAVGDVNGDGEINTTDITQLKRYLAGKRTFDW